MARQYGERHVFVISNLLFLGMFMFFYTLYKAMMMFPKGPWMGVLVTLLLSILLMAGGFINFFLLQKRKKQREELTMNGRHISGRVQAIKTNRQIMGENQAGSTFRTSLNYGKYYTIVVEGEDRVTGGAAKKIFYSDYLVRNPSSFITIGQPITVFIDNAKPDTYYVDLSFIPPEAR